VPLIFALIGLYVIEKIVQAKSVGKERWLENAHTRRLPVDGDIVVRARPGVSGRLHRCLLIGELRDRVYRVRNELLDAWGDLDIKDGYIHRSVQLPEVRDAEKFYRWFLSRHPELVAENNPASVTRCLALCCDAQARTIDGPIPSESSAVSAAPGVMTRTYCTR
jgi:hypothetical protein